MPTRSQPAREPGKCSLQTPIPNRTQCGRVHMSPEDRREVAGMFGITKAEADQAMSARPGTTGQCSSPQWQRKLCPTLPPLQETNKINLKVGVLCSLKSIREDMEPTQESKELSIIQKYVRWFPKRNKDLCYTGSEGWKWEGKKNKTQ